MDYDKIAIKYSKDKLAAIRKFAGKKNIDIDTVLTESLDKIFKKVVPTAVREFIEDGESNE